MFKYDQELTLKKHTSSGSNMYPGLNAAKGIMVFMVVLTHALPDSMMLYFFYLFHMPVFLSISGYLLKKTAFKNGFRNYFKRATQRLLVPWAIALLIYLPFSLGSRSLSQLTITDLLYPFYHLWYVPAYFIGVALCYSVAQFSIPIKLVLMITASFTLVWYICFRANTLPLTAQPLYWLGEKRFYAYLFFFFLGHALRNKYIRLFPQPILLLSITAVMFATIVVAVFKNFSDYFIAIPYLLFNTGLVLLLLLHTAPKNRLDNKFFQFLNKQSLGVYLYHPFIMFTIYRIIGDPQKQHISKLRGLGVGLLTVALTALLILLMKRWNVTNRYILGIINDKKEPVKIDAIVAAQWFHYPEILLQFPFILPVAVQPPAMLLYACIKPIFYIGYL